MKKAPLHCSTQIAKSYEINKELSVEIETEPLSAYLSLREKLSNLNRVLFKTKLNQDKIEKLEKETLRGECSESPEPVIIQKPKKQLDLLSLILKAEHKSTTEGTQIVKLPKLPYGKHKSYNEEPTFKDRHFLDEKVPKNPDRIKDLEEITRKFRLHEKKYKANKQTRLSSAKPTFSKNEYFDVYDMGPGNLVCAKDQESVEAYEKKKEEYKKVLKANYSGNFINSSGAVVNPNSYGRKKCNYNQQKKLVERLMPSNDVKDSDLSLFYSTKYSSLFETFDPKTLDPKSSTGIEFRRASVS